MKVGSIILCAGASSRMKSEKSKMLQPLSGKPLCYFSINNALSLSDRPPIVVIGHQGQEVQNEIIKFFGDGVDFATQKILDGTASAVKTGLTKLSNDCESVLVIYGDTPLITKNSLERLINLQKRSHVPIAMLSTTTDNPSGYGRIIRNQQEQVTHIIEEKDASLSQKEIKEINPGIYVFDAKFLKEIIVKLSNNNASKEYYLTDIIKSYVALGSSFGPIETLDVPYEEVLGVNDYVQLSLASKIMNNRILTKHMLQGVNIIDANNTYIEDNVVIESDVTIYPNVFLKGNTKITKGVVIENGSIISDSIIENNAHVYAYSVIDQAYIGKSSQVGPFARLRPQATLENFVKVGNFVEVKKSIIKENSKVNHVAYIGDSEIGKNCNIGAGVVICNFDGQNKHNTTILDNSFVGSNSTLIAPLIIGKNSYIAGGSTITHEVPTETLAFGRARQVIKPLKKTKKTNNQITEIDI
jgi:bifunctional UDP-N-acetylglucosamine pyrophosphorylase/glucosamine-1-phosphate N-acetyltransferase